MQFYLIRHAQSANNAGESDPTYQHVEDAPLTQMGHTQSNHLANFLREHKDDDDLQQRLKVNPVLPGIHLDALYCSPMQRALQTTAPIAASLELSPTVLMDIYEHGGIFRREGHPGSYTYRGGSGLNRQQMLDIIPDATLPDAIRDDGWWDIDFEPDDMFVGRGINVATMLREKALGDWQDRSVAFVAHADFCNLLIKTILTGTSVPLSQESSFIFPYNTSITRIDYRSDGFPIMRYFSRVEHLPIEMITL